jgi:hypothetical protein
VAVAEGEENEKARLRSAKSDGLQSCPLEATEFSADGEGED